MKKFCIALTALALSTSFATAFEWGGRFYNNSVLEKNYTTENTPMALKQTDNLNLWLKVPLSKNNLSYFTTEAFYQFKYDGTSTTEPIVNTIDLNLFKFVINKQLPKARAISMNFGRFTLSDSTYLIFSQVCDGAILKYSSQKFIGSVYGGYTGLLNSNSITILNSKTTNYRKTTGTVYGLAPQYIPFGLSLAFPGLVFNQQVTFQGWGFVDLNKDNYNRYYGTLGLSGYILPVLYYSLNSVIGTVNFESVSNLTNFKLTGYFTRTFSMNFGALYASGNQGGLSEFTGFTSMTASLSNKEPQFASLLKFDLSATKTFGKAAFINGGAACFFDVNSSSCTFNGLQFQLSANYNIFNDLQIGASFGQFIDLDNDADNNSKTQIALKAVVVF